MRMQSSEASCGPTAMKNALESLGMSHSLEECESLCRCSATRGTSTSKLLHALKTIPNLEPTRLYERKADSALYRLNGFLSLGRPAILCVDDSGHWVAAIGQLGVGTFSTRYVIADSGSMELVMTYQFQDLLKRWGPPYLAVTL